MGWAGAMLALSAGTTALGIAESREQAKAQQAQAEQDIIASQQATLQAERDVAEQEAMDLSQLAREAMRAEATAVAQQAYSGVAGVTTERVRRNVLFQSSLNEANIRADAMNKLNSIRMQGRQNQRQLENVRTSAYASRPSGLTSGLAIASAGVQGYGAGKNIERKRGTK